MDDDATKAVAEALAREQAALEALDVANKLSAGLSEVMVLADMAKKKAILAAIDGILIGSTESPLPESAQPSPSKSRG